MALLKRLNVINQFKKLILLRLLILVIQSKTNYNTKINEIENDHDDSKYITTQQFNKLTSENFGKQ